MYIVREIYETKLPTEQKAKSLLDHIVNREKQTKVVMQLQRNEDTRNIFVLEKAYILNKNTGEIKNEYKRL